MLKQPQDYKRGKKQPNTRTVIIALDSEVAERHDEAQERFQMAERMLDIKKERGGDEYVAAGEELEAAKSALEEAKVALDEESQEFVFRSIGRRAYSDLLMENQPTPTQVAEAKKAGDGEFNWNPDTFPVALLIASMISPAMDEADIKDIWESPDWSAAETMALFMAALEANSSRRVIDIPKGSSRTNSSL